MKFCRHIRAWLLPFCLLGFCLSLLLIALPDRYKSARIHRIWNDYQTVTEMKTTERGFGRHGMVFGHRATLHVDDNARHLDAFRQQWSITRTLPPPPPAIDSGMLLWNTWGPSCTSTSSGVGVVDVGLSLSIPYSIMAIAFGIPLTIWVAYCARGRRCVPVKPS